MVTSAPSSAQARELLRRPGRGDDPGAERRGELDRERADPAGAAVDEAASRPGCRPATMKTLDHTVQATSGSAAAVDQVDARRAPASAGRRARRPARRTRRRRAARTPRRRPTSRSTPSPSGRDGAAALQADDVGGAGRRRVEALRCSRSARLTAVAATLDQHLAGPGDGSGTSVTVKDLGAAGLGGDDGAHARTLTVIGRGPRPRPLRPRPRARRRSGRWSGRPVESSGTGSLMSIGVRSVRGAVPALGQAHGRCPRAARSSRGRPRACAAA